MKIKGIRYIILISLLITAGCENFLNEPIRTISLVDDVFNQSFEVAGIIPAFHNRLTLILKPIGIAHICFAKIVDDLSDAYSLTDDDISIDIIDLLDDVEIYINEISVFPIGFAFLGSYHPK